MTNLKFVLLFFVLMSSMLLPRCTSNQSLDTENMQPALSNQGGHRVIFDIMGDLYPRGLFFAAIKIGKSPDRTYHLDLDTGSDLTWVQCEVPVAHNRKALHSPYKPHDNFIPKTDPYCSSGSSISTNQLQRDRCEYRVEYKTGLSHGWLVRDTFSLQDASKRILNPSLVFGCGVYESHDKHEFKIDGVLGLGKSKLAIPTQLKDHRFIENIHGHCLGRQGKGYGFFGRGSRVQIDNALWLKMQPNEKYYVVGPAKLILDQKSPPIKDLSLVFDSGSTYTYFNTPSYHVIYSMVMHILKVEKLSLVKDPFLPVCWKHAKPFNEVKNNFSPVKLDFSEGKVILLQPGDYLITSPSGHVCIGILDGATEGLGNLNILGDISMLDKLVVYDNEKGLIGWINPANCNYRTESDQDKDFLEPGLANTSWSWSSM